MYIFDAGGRAHPIPGIPGYSRGGEEHSLVDQSASVALAPGRYRVRAEKGAEFRPAEKTVDLAAGEPARVDLDLARFFNMNERGWYSGDLHLHRRAEDMPLALRAEELNIGPVISRHLRDTPAADMPPWPGNHLVPAPGGYVASLQNQEIERLGAGHGALVLLNTPQAFEPPQSAFFPTDAEVARRAREAGAFVDAEKPIWKLVPVVLALGLIDAIGIVNNHFHPRGMLLEAEKYGAMERDKPAYKTPAGFAQWMMDLYYSFLNCGFRVPVSAGSASGIMPSWPGYERVYVHLTGPFSYQQWFRDLKAGHSMATNGPLLEVSVDGEAPGAAFDWRGPSGAVIAIEAHSQNRLDRMEIVFNGEVIRSFPAGGNAVLRTALSLTITEPGWLAVRCFEPAGETIRYAHTSPFYFLRNGQLPVKPVEALRWADYVRKLAAGLEVARYPSRAAYEEARTTFERAEAIYRRLARNGPG